MPGPAGPSWAGGELRAVMPCDLCSSAPAAPARKASAVHFLETALLARERSTGTECNPSVAATFGRSQATRWLVIRNEGGIATDKSPGSRSRHPSTHSAQAADESPCAKQRGRSRQPDGSRRNMAAHGVHKAPRLGAARSGARLERYLVLASFSLERSGGSCGVGWTRVVCARAVAFGWHGVW